MDSETIHHEFFDKRRGKYNFKTLTDMNTRNAKSSDALKNEYETEYGKISVLGFFRAIESTFNPPFTYPVYEGHNILKRFQEIEIGN